MKSSPPVLDILRFVLRIERFSVVTGPIGIIAIVAILSPMDGSLKYIDAAKMPIDQPGCAVRPTFALRSHLAVAGRGFMESDSRKSRDQNPPT